MSDPIIIALRLDASPALLAAIADLAAALRGGFATGAPAVIASPVTGGGIAPATARCQSTGKSPAAPQTPPARRKNGAWITEARDALLRELIPTPMSMTDILERVNALPGPHPGKILIRSRCNATLKLARPAELTPPGLRARLAAKSGGDTAASPIVESPLLPPIGTVGPVHFGENASKNNVSIEQVKSVEFLATSLGVLVRSVPPAKPPSPTIAQLAREPLIRKSADRQQIISFCEARGMRFDKFDIGVINKRLGTLGHPGFDLTEPSRRVRNGH